MIDCPHCLRLNSGVDMVVHSNKELAAAIGAAASLRVPVAHGWCATEEERSAFVVVIEWHRPTGVTTYRLRPDRPLNFRTMGRRRWDREPEMRDTKYERMFKRAWGLKPRNCK
jgi:hypothetical protein